MSERGQLAERILEMVAASYPSSDAVHVAPLAFTSADLDLGNADTCMETFHSFPGFASTENRSAPGARYEGSGLYLGPKAGGRLFLGFLVGESFRP